MAESRDKTLQMRVTDDEYEIINKKADQLGLSTSNYMRMVCLHAKIDVSLSPGTKISNDDE